MAVRPASIKVRAMQWLAQREHSRSELRTKLLRLLAGMRRAAQPAETDTAAAATDDTDAAVAAPTAAGEVDALLDWLEVHGYLSPGRFIESRVHARQGRYGNLRITHELHQHGLGLDGVALQALRDSELDRARVVWRKKFGRPADDAAGRVRQMRFLSGRGFSAEVIRRVVRGSDDSDDTT